MILAERQAVLAVPSLDHVRQTSRGIVVKATQTGQGNPFPQVQPDGPQLLGAANQDLRATSAANDPEKCGRHVRRNLLSADCQHPAEKWFCHQTE